MHQEYQNTLRAPVGMEGIGIHGGRECTVEIEPAAADYGIRFVRSDMPSGAEIPAHIQNVSREPMMRQTILCSPEDPAVQVRTVEHILAALRAFSIDNARVKMSAEEPPIGDGSIFELAQAMQRTGTETLEGAAKPEHVVPHPCAFSPDEAPHVEFRAWPSQSLTLTYFLEQDHPMIGSQSASFAITPETFVNEIAGARTWCTYQEIEFLRAHDLIKGGTPDNAIVLGDDRILNTELRWEDELARHKLLDFLGDLALLGRRPRGHFTAHRSGHQSNAQFVEHIRKEHK